MKYTDRTIVAASTATGGALSLIRLSGPNACSIVQPLFSGELKDRVAQFGDFCYKNELIDEVVVIFYKGPRSYTGEDSIEITCHGSKYITNRVIQILIENGAKMATPGEFTMRAFLNGRMDLSQAEAVSDLIAADSRSSARVALQQMRGGYSEELAKLSAQLLEILSLLELELDFGEEDVEFADRSQLKDLITKIYARVTELGNSFRVGNVLKNGVPVAIVGKPNVGKSTLLNRLIGEERAIVSSVAGTTRDFIEETMIIDDLTFRFIDTAGLRSTNDEIEKLGIERSYEKLRAATIVLQLVEDIKDLENLELNSNQKQIVILNKCDLHEGSEKDFGHNENTISISAKYGTGIPELKEMLVRSIELSDYDSNSIIVSNVRHYEALKRSEVSFKQALEGIELGLSTDMISAEIRQSLLCLGEITGEITTDDILGNIFANFCIGK